MECKYIIQTGKQVGRLKADMSLMRVCRHLNNKHFEVKFGSMIKNVRDVFLLFLSNHRL